MAQKNLTQLKRQLEIIKENGLNPALYVVIEELEHKLIVKNRFTGTVKVIDK